MGGGEIEDVVAHQHDLLRGHVKGGGGMEDAVWGRLGRERRVSGDYDVEVLRLQVPKVRKCSLHRCAAIAGKYAEAEAEVPQTMNNLFRSGIRHRTRGACLLMCLQQSLQAGALSRVGREAIHSSRG
jgi:hypothetical protein